MYYEKTTSKGTTLFPKTTTGLARKFYGLSNGQRAAG